MLTATERQSVRAYCTRVLAVMVCYRTDIPQTATLTSLSVGLATADARLDLFIYDNSPQAGHDCLEIIGSNFSADYRHDPTNPGVSRAYNEGALLARERGKQWLLLLDQDTTFPIDALAAYARALVDQPEAQMIVPILRSGAVIVSPCRFVAGFGLPLQTPLSGRLSLSGHSVLNSGMLIRLETFQSIGGFNERIPLDFADHDFCRRYADRYEWVQVLPVACQHGFADREATTIAKDLHRFSYFCRGARQSIPGPISAGGYLLATLLRCAILCWRHRSLCFVPVLWREFFVVQRSNEAG